MSVNELEHGQCDDNIFRSLLLLCMAYSSGQSYDIVRQINAVTGGPVATAS